MTSILGDNRLPELAASIRAAHEAVECSANEMAERALEAGSLLLEPKLAAGHGNWLPWLRDNVGISERTARRYMALAKSGLKSATVADLGITGSLFAAAKLETPVPESGQIVVGTDTKDNQLFLWPIESDGSNFIHALLLTKRDDESGEGIAMRKPVLSDLFLRYLFQCRSFDQFNFANAEFETIKSFDLGWLEEIRQIIAVPEAA